MKDTMTFINLIFSVFGAILVISIAASSIQSKDTLIIAIIIWLYILCNFLALKGDDDND